MSRIVYTIPQAAEAAQTGRTKLYAEIRIGRLPVVKIGRKTLIRRETLEQWLREAETPRVSDGRFSAAVPAAGAASAPRVESE